MSGFMTDFEADLARPHGVLPPGGPLVSPTAFGPGSWTFTCPAAGLYAFRLWGAGGSGCASGGQGNGGGGGGAYARKFIRLAQGQKIPVTVGARVTGDSVVPSSTTASLPSGVVSAGSGQNASSFYGGPGGGGTATGGDVNYAGGAGGFGAPGSSAQGDYPGTPGGVANGRGGGGSAAGDSILRGGSAGTVESSQNLGQGGFPGGGASASSGGVWPGSDGFALITYEGP